MLWTARSMRPSSRASSISFVKRPLPPIFASGTSRILSPVVLMGTRSTCKFGQRLSSSPLVQLACQRANALPRVPSLTVRRFISSMANIEDFSDEIGEFGTLGIVRHLLQLLNGRVQNLVHDGLGNLIHGCLLLGRKILQVPAIPFD